MKILLIEDDEGFANGLRDIMQISDYHVEVALNGHTALDLIKENDYSAVIVDLNLPDFDGTQLISEIYKLRKDIQTLILTGDTSRDAAVQAINVGADAFLTKPIDFNTFFETLERMELVYSNKLIEKALVEERIKLKQAQKLDELRNQFINTATHEIKTPISAILGYTELISDSFHELPEDVQDYFKVIQRNVDRLLALTNDLLEVQRIESGRAAVEMGTHNIMALLEQIGLETYPILEGKGQNLVISSQYHGNWFFDMNRIIQVLLNLVSNASKYSPEGSDIHLRAYPLSSKLFIEVRDEGVGIREEDIEKLFIPFPDILVKGKTDSTGLGLSICKGILELHNGEIWCDSGGVGMGSRFTFMLPKKKSGTPRPGDNPDFLSSTKTEESDTVRALSSV